MGLLAAPPANEFALQTPSDGAIYAPDNNFTRAVTLSYVLHGHPAATRLCLWLGCTPLTYYRGPILSRNASAMIRFAAGCFAPGQPVTLRGLSIGEPTAAIPRVAHRHLGLCGVFC